MAISARLDRKSLRRLAALWATKLAAVAAFSFVGCGPIGPIPGGALSGPIGAADTRDWSFAADVENAQLETRPEDPHSVNTWFVAVGPDLYVPTSMILGPKAPTERSWVTHVRDDDRIRIRLGSTVFERRAVRVGDGSEEYLVARVALEERYEIAPEDRDPERKIWIFRLDPRTI